MILHWIRYSVVACLLLPFGAGAQSDTIGVYLMWQRDPATTMTVNWVNLYEHAPTKVWYRTVGASGWQSQAGQRHAVSPSVLQMHRVELTGLDPDRVYEFGLGDKAPSEDKTTKEIKGGYKFRTMPAALARPVRFVVGGDMMHSRQMADAMNRRAGALDPDFAVFGGDLAYANGVDATRWIDWFQSWTLHGRGKGGRLIPMVVGIGNHEVRSGSKMRAPEDAPYYHGFFALPGGRSNFAIDFGRYLSLVALDSGHMQPVAGAQTKWLEETLGARAGQQYLFPFYHYPAYGTAKSSKGAMPYENARAVEIRNHWVPLFERYGISAAFEHDHHNYKRTHPLLQHRRDDVRGIVYLGDGAWGVNTRTVPTNAWYLAHAEPRRHLFHVTLHPEGRVSVAAVDADGLIFDRTTIEHARTPPLAAAP